MDVDEFLAKLDARLPAGKWDPYAPLTTDEQRKVIRIAINARAEVKRLELELRQARASSELCWPCSDD